MEEEDFIRCWRTVMKEIIKAKILDKQEVISGIFKFTIYSPKLSQESKPGQFLNIKCGQASLLKRPISISDVNKNEETIEFIFQVKGKGTSELAEIENGRELEIMGPLGNGFTIDSNFKRSAVLGGGIGIFPLVYLVKELSGNTATFLGFRDKSLILMEEQFKEISTKLYIATDDGSYGEKGRVTDLLKEKLQNGEIDMIYACGPKPMLKSLKKIAKEFNIPCQISLEERMACGVGACLGCACKVNSTHDDWDYKHVCKDGPIFWASEVNFDE